jgi:hypothetical protein
MPLQESRHFSFDPANGLTRPAAKPRSKPMPASKLSKRRAGLTGKSGQLWVAVKVERGFICEARVYKSFSAAKWTEQRWRSRLNPDYDEAAVLESRLT